METDDTDNESLHSNGCYPHDSRDFRRHNVHRRHSLKRIMASTEQETVPSNATSGEFGKSLEDSLSSDVLREIIVNTRTTNNNVLHQSNNDRNTSASLEDSHIHGSHTHLPHRHHHHHHHQVPQIRRRHSDNELTLSSSYLRDSTITDISPCTLKNQKENISNSNAYYRAALVNQGANTMKKQPSSHKCPSNSFGVAETLSSSISEERECNSRDCCSSSTLFRYPTPLHLVSYENHLSRISMYDDDDDEYGFYDAYEDLPLPLLRGGQNTTTSSGIRMFSSVTSLPSGLYVDDILLASQETSHQAMPTPRELQQQQQITSVNDTMIQQSSNKRDSDEVADVDCYPLKSSNHHNNSLSIVSASPPTVNDTNTHKNTTISTTTMITGVNSIGISTNNITVTTSSYQSHQHDDDDNDSNNNHDNSDSNSIGQHVICIMDNHKASLFCRSFSECHNNIIINIPVYIGLYGLRIIQEPYCRLYSIIEYKVKVIVNHQEYNVWKRYDDFIKLATSCQRLSDYYSTHSSVKSQKRRITSERSTSSSSSSNKQSNGTKSTWFPSCLCPSTDMTMVSSSTSLYADEAAKLGNNNSSSLSNATNSSNNSITNDDDINLQETLAMWKKVEQHRPYWFFQPTHLTRFACEESKLLENFLQHLIFEVPNMQLICEFIM